VVRAKTYGATEVLFLKHARGGLSRFRSLMIRLLYNLLFPVGLLLFLPAYVVKMRRRGNYQRISDNVSASTVTLRARGGRCTQRRGFTP
jgi:hypothetical protein